MIGAHEDARPIGLATLRERVLAHQTVLAVALITLAGLVIRLIGAERESLWFDEGYSLWFSRQSFADLLGDAARAEFNPPLYYVLLHGWRAIFGESDLALRSLSAVLDCAAIPFIYLTARWSLPRPSGDSVGLLAAALFAMAFAEMQYSQEARTFTLTVLTFALVCAASARIIRDETAARLDGRTRLPAGARLWPFVLLGLGASLTIWSHFTAALFLAAAGAFHLGFWLVAGRAALPLLKRYLIAAGVFFVTAAPALWQLFAYALPATEEFFASNPDVWEQDIALADIVDRATFTFGAAFGLENWRAEILLRLAVFGVWPLLGLLALFRQGGPRERAAGLMLVAASAGAFGLFQLANVLGHPTGRGVYPAQIGWTVLCASAPLLFAPGRLRLLTGGAVFAAFTIGAASFFTHPDLNRKEPWRETARFIDAHTPPGAGTVYALGTGAVLLEHYLHDHGRHDIDVIALPQPLAIPERRAPFTPHYQPFAATVSDEAEGQLSDLLKDDEIAWFVARSPERAELAPVRRALAAHGAAEPLSSAHGLDPLGVYRIPDLVAGDEAP